MGQVWNKTEKKYIMVGSKCLLKKELTDSDYIQKLYARKKAEAKAKAKAEAKAIADAIIHKQNEESKAERAEQQRVDQQRVDQQLVEYLKREQQYLKEKQLKKQLYYHY